MIKSKYLARGWREFENREDSKHIGRHEGDGKNEQRSDVTIRLVDKKDDIRR